jgi:hypothetical protein
MNKTTSVQFSQSTDFGRNSRQITPHYPKEDAKQSKNACHFVQSAPFLGYFTKSIASWLRGSHRMPGDSS